MNVVAHRLVGPVTLSTASVAGTRILPPHNEAFMPRWELRAEYRPLFSLGPDRQIHNLYNIAVSPAQAIIIASMGADIRSGLKRSTPLPLPQARRSFSKEAFFS